MARQKKVEDQYDSEFYTPPKDRTKGELEAKNDSQRYYLSSIDRNTLTFGVGPAGTGKTYVAAFKAAKALLDRKVEKIIITRPVVEAGENLGFLPGELNEKFDPYFRPVRNALEEFLGKGRTEYLVKKGIIVAMPMAYMRGHSFDNCFVIFDEAQNATQVQMKLFLTRLGNGSTAVVNGDLKQRDLASAKGLEDAMQRLASVQGVEVVEFSERDIVRSGFVQDVVNAYEARRLNGARSKSVIMRSWTPTQTPLFLSPLATL